MSVTMKHPWLAYSHRKKIGLPSHLVFEVIVVLLLLQQGRESSTAKKIIEKRTPQSLYDYCYKDVQMKGVAE